MEEFSEHQNNIFGKIFKEIKKNKQYYSRSEALTMLKLNDDNFTTLYKDPDNEVIGDDEDIDLVYQRAKHLKLI
jgi:hypothetical protein